MSLPTLPFLGRHDSCITETALRYVLRVVNKKGDDKVCRKQCFYSLAEELRLQTTDLGQLELSVHANVSFWSRSTCNVNV